MYHIHQNKMKTILKKIGKGVLYLLGALLIVLILASIFLWIKSPGKPQPITDSSGITIPGSISSIEKVTLGGVEQYIIVRGEDSTKPVMLFLHGGPGSPEFVFISKGNPDLEKNFVMVYWEQRGAGMSYSNKIKTESMTVPQLISDTRELTLVLKQRFNQEKIFLMGHSWGSFLGILTSHKFPELYHAYFGIGQVCAQYWGERVSFEWVKEQAIIRNDKKGLKKLTSMTFPDTLATIDPWISFIMNEREYVSRYGGGVTREMTSLWPYIKMILAAKEYTLSDKFKYMAGSMFSLKHLWLDVVNTNLHSEIDSMQIPVYIFNGIFDYQTPYVVAKDFFNQLNAPEKDFFTFDNSAHSPIVEEADKFNTIVLDITKKF